MRLSASRWIFGIGCSAIASAGQAGYAVLVGPTLHAATGMGDPLRLALLAFGIAAIRAGALIGEAHWMGGASARAVRDLRMKLQRRFLALPLAFFRRQAVGDLVVRLLEDARAIESVVAGRIALARESLAATALLVVAAVAEPRLCAIALVTVPIAWLAAAMVGKRTRFAARDEREATGRLGARAAATLVAMRDVKATAQENRELGLLGIEADAALAAQQRRLRTRATLPALNEIAAAIGLLGALWLGARLRVPADRLLTFFAAVLFLYRPAKGIGQALATLDESRAGVKRVNEILEQPEERAGGVVVPPLRRGVYMHEVSLTYSGASVAALVDVSFDARVGEIVAIAGPSGAGKTTLTLVLGGLLEPSAGAVWWDDLSQASANLRSWRQATAYVAQQPLLLDATVREIVDDFEIAKSLRIEQLWHRRVGERGEQLSAGEAQRVALAAALKRRASLIVLDEPSSALDRQNERLLVEALRHAARGAAIVLVSHSETLAAHADRVVRIENGRLLPEAARASLA